jgi:hypothetical protein
MKRSPYLGFVYPVSHLACVEQTAYAGVSRARPGSYDEQQIFQGQKLNENTQHEYTDLDQWTEYTYCLTACRIKDSSPNDMSLNSCARTHGCSISFVLQIILIN